MSNCSPETEDEQRLAPKPVQLCIRDQKMTILGLSGRLAVSASYELLSVSVDNEFRLDPEMADRVLSFTQSCPAEYKGPEKDGPGVREPFGCIGSLCAPVRGRKGELSNCAPKRCCCVWSDDFSNADK